MKWGHFDGPVLNDLEKLSKLDLRKMQKLKLVFEKKNLNSSGKWKKKMELAQKLKVYEPFPGV